MVSQAEKAKKFRKLHEREGAFVMPNPWDAGTAKMLESLGFEALGTTSAGSAFTLGLPDGYSTNQDVLENCYVICEATDVPVSADLEQGFGDSPQDVAETIRQAAPTGIVGGSIEDHTGRLGNPIYDFSLAVERVEAAVEAARALPHDFVLTARCENFLHERANLDDTIKRLQAYEKAGADVLYAPALPDLEAIKAVCRAVEKPVNVLMGLPGYHLSIADLENAGVKRISIGAGFAKVAYTAMFEAVKEIQDKGTFEFNERTVSTTEIEKLLK